MIDKYNVHCKVGHYKLELISMVQAKYIVQCLQWLEL